MTRRDWLAGGVGAALAAVVLVALQQTILAGDATGRAPRSAASAGSAAIVTSPSAESDQAWRTANANLAELVKVAQQRLERNEAEKKELEQQLKAAQAKLAAAQGDGAPPRNEFDLTQGDWKELAKTGTVKARYPCRFDPDWHIGPEQAATLGLSPADAAAVERAFIEEENRLAGVIQAGCTKVLGNAELARKLGTQVCDAVVTQSAKDNRADLQLVADVRAGNVPTPPADKLDAFAAMLLAESGSMPALQADLAATFGPEDAHRIAFADLGSCTGTWGGPPPKP